MPPKSDPVPGLGDFDGEPIEAVGVTLAAGGALDRRLTAGERVILIAEGTVAAGVTVKRTDGRLVRQHRIVIDRIAEPFDELADETAAFLAAIADELDGRAQLPFEADDEPSDDAAGDDEPEA